MSGQEVDDCPVKLTTECQYWDAKLYQACNTDAYVLSSVVINLDGVQ